MSVPLPPVSGGERPTPLTGPSVDHSLRTAPTWRRQAAHVAVDGLSESGAGHGIRAWRGFRTTVRAPGTPSSIALRKAIGPRSRFRPHAHDGPASARGDGAPRRCRTGRPTPCRGPPRPRERSRSERSHRLRRLPAERPPLCPDTVRTSGPGQRIGHHRAVRRGTVRQSIGPPSGGASDSGPGGASGGGGRRRRGPGSSPWGMSPDGACAPPPRGVPEAVFRHPAGGPGVGTRA